MTLHPDFQRSSPAIFELRVRWFPADEVLRDTSKSLLNWWFKEPHLLPQADGTMAGFQYFFAGVQYARNN